MLTQIPNLVDDPKEAVLWAVYDRLQRIDENPGSRINFATTIAYNHSVGLNDKVFDHEIELIRDILKIPVPPKDINEADSKVRQYEEPNLANQLRDEL